jgi:hypothetical protein
VRIFGRLPAPVSKAFAALLNVASRPFDVVNYWGSVGGARIINHRRMAALLDRIIASLQRRLVRERDADLERGMHYPIRWDPFFKPFMTLADIYRFPTQHFQFHRDQLTIRPRTDPRGS